MKFKAFVAGLLFALATACAGIARAPSIPAERTAPSVTSSGETAPPQRLYVAYHAKAGDWIGEYTTGDSPSLVLQIAQNVAKPYALYADAKGVVYSAQKGFSEYDATTGQYLRTAIGGRPSPAPAVASNGTIYWGVYRLSSGRIFEIPPGQTQATNSRRSQGPRNILLSPNHDVWVNAVGTLGTNEYDSNLVKIHHYRLNHEIGIDGDRLFALDGGSDTVVVYDLKTLKAVLNIYAGRYPVSVAFDGQHNVYVERVNLDYTGGALEEYKAGTANLVRTISLGTGIPYNSTVDAAGYVYVANALKGEVDVYPPGSSQRSGTIVNGDAPEVLTVSER